MASLRKSTERFASASRAVHCHRLRRRPLLEGLEDRSLPSTFTVNSLGDAGSGSSNSGDLRYCINQANANNQANTIVFSSTVFGTPQTIKLSGGELELKDTGGTQTITAPAAGVTISGGGKTGIFLVDKGVTASISGLTIYGGGGSGVFNNGTATLTDCTISGNTSEGGGGVFNGGTITLTGCTVSGNTASEPVSNYYGTVNLAAGGGVFNSGTATLTGCTISGNNAAGGGGGGVYNSGPGYNHGVAKLTMTDCTVVGNYGVFLDGEFELGGGAGVDNKGTASLTDCTISGNFAGGGLQDAPTDSGTLYATTTLIDTIVAGNTDFDISASNVSGSNNLIGTGGSGGLVNGVDGNIVLTNLTNLGLTPLGAYGGPTQTMALLRGSPAVGAGVTADYPGTTTPITTDQRGLKLDSPKPDIGAFQTQGSPLLTPTFSVSNQTITYGTPSVTISGTLESGSQAPVGQTVAVTLAGVVKSATIGSGGAFSTTFDTAGLVLANTITYAYTYTTGGLFATASATSTLTITSTHFTWTVVSLGDLGTGSGTEGDLRYCIDEANSDNTENTIVFGPTLFGTPQTITLSGNELELTDTSGMQTITGPAAGVTISAGGKSRVFQIDNGVTASISGLTISDGFKVGATQYGGSSVVSHYGGGLANYGTATLTDCTISGNSCVTEISTYYSTYGDGGGGGVSNSGTLTLTGCTISGNGAGRNGGGLYNGGTANLTDCTFFGNSASNGGGAFGNIDLINCTVSGNNSGVFGGGTLTDTIIAGNGGVDIEGNFASSSSYDLIGINDSYDLANGVNHNIVLGFSSPGLASLGNYGGPTQTMPLLPGSPALGAGIKVSGVTTDQRGEPLDSPKPDIGAFQSQGFTFTPLAGSTPQSTATGTAFANPLAVTVTAKNPIEPVAAGFLTFTAPASGPSATLFATTATIGSGGSAAVTATANATAGSYTVVASGGGASTADFALTNNGNSRSLVPLFFSGVSAPTITYGASSVIVSGTLDNGSQAPVGESVAVSLDGIKQSAKIESGGAFSTTFADVVLNVAGSPYTINYVYSSDGSYAATSTTSTLTVKPAPFTITAKPETKVYGTSDPALAYTATGFQFSDTAATVLSGALAQAQAGTLAGEQVGGYAIGQGTLAADSNYTISFTGNTLTITPAPLTVKANTQTKVYGSNDPTLTVTPTGLVDSTVDGVAIDDTAATVLSGQLARSAGQTVAGGPYAITQGTLAADRDYTMSFIASALKITPATLAIAAKPETKVFGSADPTLAYTASGFEFSDTAATILTGQLTRAAGQTVAGSPYAISQGTLAANTNYTIKFTGSSLSITKATPTVTVSDAGGTYTGKAFPARALVTGVGVAAAASLEGVTPTLNYYAGSGTSGKNLGSTAPSAVGTYTVVANFAGSADYVAAQSKPFTFVIAPAAGVRSDTTNVPASQVAAAIVRMPHPILQGKKKLEARGLTVEISPLALGGGVPTGQVTFEFAKKRRFAARLGMIIAFWLAAGVAQAPAQEGLSHAEAPALSRRLKRIDQDKLLLGDYTLREVMENGRHLFTTPFTKAEGYGEGGKPNVTGGFLIGPREASFRQNLDAFRLQTQSGLSNDQLRQFLNFPVPEVNPTTQKIVYPYLRLNGLDSQACWECHNFIGTERLPDTRTYALARKQSTTGGAGGFAGDAFINPDLPNPLFMFIRNPPHTFGSGYAQELAEEMTLDLLGLRTIALRDALANPGVAASQPLVAKTIDFGFFVVTYTGDPGNKPGLKTVIDQLNDHPGQDPPGFLIQWDKIQAVSADLVVRPFQFKGIASNTRNFVRDACQFHFGMEPRESNPGFGTPSENHDSDNDGIPDELSLGDVSALTVYTMAIRPPFEVQSRDDAENRLAKRGRNLFEGNEILTKAVSCARCHTPFLHLIDSIVVVNDPRKNGAKFGPEQLVGNGIGLSAQVKSSAQLPVVRRFMELDPVAAVTNRDAGSALNLLRQTRTRYERTFFEPPNNRLDGYAFNLTTLKPANRSPNSPPEPRALSETQPRLPAAGETIEVPLFSDLRRHKMGKGLKERFAQTTDVAGLVVPGDEFLTRPLWGVGDTGPWLHDGRAQSLEEAILLHRSDGSEANDVIDAFTKLPRGDQDAILKFLLTLRLPLDPRYGFDDYR